MHSTLAPASFNAFSSAEGAFRLASGPVLRTPPTSAPNPAATPKVDSRNGKTVTYLTPPNNTTRNIATKTHTTMRISSITIRVAIAAPPVTSVAKLANQRPIRGTSSRLVAILDNPLVLLTKESAVVAACLAF